MISIKSIQKIDIDPVWLLRIFTFIPPVLIVLGGIIAIWLYLFAISLLPESKSQIEIPGLSGDVKVIRDSNGNPTIMSENPQDLPLVLGYVMAQDRLWQMDYLRKAGQGRLSELLGSDFIEKDHVMRGLKFGKKLDSPLDNAERDWLDRFVQGINKYIAQHSRKLPVEFSLLEYRPEPFVTDDVQSIIMAVCVSSSRAFRFDPLLIQALTKLPAQKRDQILLKDSAGPTPLLISDMFSMDVQSGMFSKSYFHGGAFPSIINGCAWSMNQVKSKNGRAMSACSIAQRTSAPGFFYKARLYSKDIDISGTYIPGVPAGLIGTNKSISWACTPAAVDDADLFIEQLDSDTPKSFWRIDRWKRIEKRDELYSTKHGNVRKTLYITEAGPIVSDPSKQKAFALKWVGKDGSRFFSGLFRLNRASTGRDVKTVAKIILSPSVNIVWASEDGSFGSQLAGRIPVRAAESDGICPMPAYTGVHDWKGYVSFNDLPFEKNTASGFAIFANSNDAFQKALFSGCYWDDATRLQRITSLLNASSEHGKESFQTILNDNYSQLARDVIAYVKSTHHQQIDEATLNFIIGWNCEMAQDSPGAAFFSLWTQSLAEDLFANSFGPDVAKIIALDPELQTKLFISFVRNGIVTHDTDFAKRLTLSLAKAAEHGKSVLGQNMNKWKWGILHKTEFTHPLAAKSRFLEMVYNVGPITTSGGLDTINSSLWSFNRPFYNVAGTTLREIQEQTDPPQGFSVTTLGTSAHFFSAHYKDQTNAWRNGRLYKAIPEIEDVAKTGSNLVTFKPSMSQKSKLQSASY